MSQPPQSNAAAHPQPADPVFTRLLADICLAKTVQRHIEIGLAPAEPLAEAMRELERRAWHHLGAYVAAVAFASPMTD